MMQSIYTTHTKQTTQNILIASKTSNGLLMDNNIIIEMCTGYNVKIDL